MIYQIYQRNRLISINLSIAKFYFIISLETVTNLKYPCRSGTVLVVHEDGTFELQDTGSEATLWEISTDNPLPSQSQLYIPTDSEYFLFPGQGSELYVFTRSAGIEVLFIFYFLHFFLDFEYHYPLVAYQIVYEIVKLYVLDKDYKGNHPIWS